MIRKLAPRTLTIAFLLVGATLAAQRGKTQSPVTEVPQPPAEAVGHKEVPHDPPAPQTLESQRITSPAEPAVRGSFVSVQVNVDAAGNNIVGDAANEPSIAIDPTNPGRMVIGWRQFDSVASNFRQAGYGYSRDAGSTWTFPGVLTPGTFRSDPVLEMDAKGNFYYYSLRVPQPQEFVCDVFKSSDGGVTWGAPVYAFGGDKAWLTIDRTGGVGHGNIYCAWSPFGGCCDNDIFNRSTNGGATFSTPIALPQSLRWGTLSVGPDGALYVAGATSIDTSVFVVAKSTDAQLAFAAPTFSQVSSPDLGGPILFQVGPNPGGLLGQVWIATDHSGGSTHGNVYVLASVNRSGIDLLDVMFVRSTDGGATWSDPVRVNDDPVGNGWQWFGTMSVAPNGRIDVIWNDTRSSGLPQLSEVFYSSSVDGGVTWSTNIPVSPMFNSTIGWPNQDKIGDYYDMISDNTSANLAYSATFNDEQDVYFLRIGEQDCNDNGIDDQVDIAQCPQGDITCADCNANLTLDGCEGDCNDTGIPDDCDVDLGVSTDCNENFIPDECEQDFDGDGIIDGCDPDGDDDGVFNETDLCPFTPLGTPVDSRGRPISDNNQNCVIDLSDFPRFFDCFELAGPGVQLGGPCTDSADYNGDRDVDLQDAAGFFNVFGR